jgi:hypothetical protein
MKGEGAAGGSFHYFTGAAVALIYPLIFLIAGVPMPENNLVPGLIWGMATVLLPWFVLFPVFGWGWFGFRAPPSVRPLLSPSVEHLLYGCGLAITLNVAL